MIRRAGTKRVAFALAVLTAAGGLHLVTAGTAAAADCVTVDMASSPEKIDLLTDLAKRFNNSDRADVDGQCIAVRVTKKSSGEAASLLADDWPDQNANGPRPVIWSPAASAWGEVANQRRADQNKKPIAPTGKPFMLTPLVIAMPQPMAEVLGYPNTPVGYGDILRLANDPAGWGAFGHPEWGPFRLGKTNPNFSTSALNATIAQYYAASGKTNGLTLEDLNRPDVDAFARSIESSVVHYGDTTLTFLNNLYRADQRGTGLTYVSAVAVEEKSVIDFNKGNPDGILDPGEKPKPPRVPLVAIYPKEGTLFSDNPLYTVDAPWVSAKEKQAAAKFEQYLQEPANQKRVLRFGFRPGNPRVAIGAPIDAKYGVDPNQPQTTLELPPPPVLVGLIDRWGQNRKSARVLMVIDVSGSMGDPAAGAGGPTKLELAKKAAVNALSQFKPEDDVGLWIFSTGISRTDPTDYLELVPIGPIGVQRETIAAKINDLVPTQGTPLYTVTKAADDQLVQTFDAGRINAVLLLTDGKNEDPNNDDLDALLRTLRSRNEGQVANPVRVFPIAYGQDADLPTLKRIAEATNATVYDAADPASIGKVFLAVVSNF
ncbi:MAG TPA: extracellular solute-binding protein [Acidimicrobiia bacterium]|nr:extracellular solute-binding protein [Acidimicrobiia bacterium]